MSALRIYWASLVEGWRVHVNPAICRVLGHVEFRYEPPAGHPLSRLVWCRRCGKLPENW